MKIQPRDKRALLRAALGEIKSDLAIKNVQLVNVITGEIYPASVYVYDGFISHVEYKEPGREEQFAKEVVDGQGKYLIPGLIDAHEHIEMCIRDRVQDDQHHPQHQFRCPDCRQRQRADSGIE